MDTASSRVMDVHLHGVAEFDTQTESPDEILSIAAIERAEGVGEIVLSIYPAPIPVMRGQMAAVKEAMERQGPAISYQRSGRASAHNNQHTTPVARSGARILGVHLEGPFLNPACCGALDPGAFLTPSWRDYRELTEGFEEIVRSITVAPELEGAPLLIRQVVGSGTTVNMGHSDATFSEAEAGFHAGATGVVHIFNAMRPFDHREPGIAGFALTNPSVYVEVIADPHHLHQETIHLVFLSKPPSRILIVSDSVKGQPFGTECRAMAQEQCIPRMADGGKLRGGSMSVVASAARLIEAGFDESVVMTAITDNPTRFINRF